MQLRQIVYKNDDDFYAKHNVHCEVCSLPGKVLRCSSCTLVFYLHCVQPSLKKYPSDNWRCAFCLEECNKSNQRIQNQAKKACQEMKQMQIDMTVRHEEDEEEEEVEEDVVEDKVKFNLFLNTQHDILEDLDDCGDRKKNGSVDESRQFLKQYPRCLHTLAEDKRYVPATRTNDSGSKKIKWTKTAIVAMGKNIGDGIDAPTIVDTKTAILRMGSVLDADVGIRKFPQFLLDKYMCNDVIRKKYIVVILLTGETVFMHTELDNTVTATIVAQYQLQFLNWVNNIHARILEKLSILPFAKR